MGCVWWEWIPYFEQCVGLKISSTTASWVEHCTTELPCLSARCHYEALIWAVAEWRRGRREPRGREIAFNCHLQLIFMRAGMAAGRGGVCEPNCCFHPGKVCLRRHAGSRNLGKTSTIVGNNLYTLCLSGRLEELRLPRARPQTRPDARTRNLSKPLLTQELDINLQM